MSQEAHQDGPESPCLIEPGIDLDMLVERIRCGNAEGMAELYALVHHRVARFFERTLGVQDAEDQAHDTFLLVVEAIRDGRLRSAQALMGFVYTIARRRLAQEIEDAVRSRQRHAPGDGDRFPDWRRNPEQQMIVREEVSIAETALDRLSASDREVLCRFYLSGQTAQQICAEMNLTGTQFRLLKWRAKSRFSEMGKRLHGPGRAHLRILLRDGGSYGIARLGIVHG